MCDNAKGGKGGELTVYMCCFSAACQPQPATPHRLSAHAHVLQHLQPFLHTPQLTPSGPSPPTQPGAANLDMDPLDDTRMHPEAYQWAVQMAQSAVGAGEEEQETAVENAFARPQVGVKRVLGGRGKVGCSGGL